MYGFILIFIVVGIVIFFGCKSQESFIKPAWIQQETPVPELYSLSTRNTVKSDDAYYGSFYIAQDNKQRNHVKNIIKRSVDPGVHLVCEGICKKNSKSNNQDLLNVCIDMCMQEKWENPNSNIYKFKP